MKAYEIFSQYYDLLDLAADNAARYDFLCSLIDGKRGSPVLDAGCGTGALCVYLAKKGFDVIGVDSSEGMLSKAMDKALKSKTSPLFLNQKLEELDLYGTVGATFCVSDTLNHLPDSRSLAKAIERISLFTEKGGLFVFDLNTEYKHRQILENNSFVIEGDSVFCAWQNAVKKNGDVAITLDIFAQKGEGYSRETLGFNERLVGDDEIFGLLEKNGFAVTQILDGETLKQPNETTQRKLFVAGKEL